jgi:hypothetical protein
MLPSVIGGPGFCATLDCSSDCSAQGFNLRRPRTRLALISSIVRPITQRMPPEAQSARRATLAFTFDRDLIRLDLTD